jgi:hypothetical protein
VNRIVYSERSHGPGHNALAETFQDGQWRFPGRYKNRSGVQELAFDADPDGEAETDPWMPGSHESLPFTFCKCNFTM